METEKLSLSVQELIYLAKQTEGTMLPGITNPYEYISAAQQEEAMSVAEEKLIESGIIKASFGGKKTVHKAAMELVSCCTLSRKYIGFDRKDPLEDFRTERFYNHKDRWVHIGGDNAAFYLEYVDAERIRAELLETMPPVSEKMQGKKEFLMPLSEWKEQKSRIMDGKSYFALTLIEHVDSRLMTQSVSVLYDADDTMEFYQTVKQDRTMIGLLPAKKGIYPLMKEVAEQWLTVSL